MLRNTPAAYGLVTKLLHWSIASILLIQIALGISIDYVSRDIFGIIIFWHKSFGLLLLLLAVLLVIWRLINVKPKWSEHMPVYEKVTARVVHITLYISLIAMPLTGWIMSTAAGYIPSFFGWFEIAAPFITKNAAVASTFSSLHETMAWIICLLVAVHTGAALKHHFIDKDDIFKRMKF